MSDSVNEPLIKIGQITGAHGVRGEVRVFPLTNFPERFERLRSALLGPDAHEVKLQTVGTVKGLLLLKIEGIDDRNAAEKLRDQYLQVPKSEVWQLPEGHYYDFELEGLAIVDPAGNRLGTLVAVDHGSPVHALYVVETAPGKRYLVPAVKAFVREINLQAGHVMIEPIPGLLED